MTGTPLFGPKTRFFDDDGNPLAGGKVYTYLAGTTTPTPTYTTYTLAVENTNPVILDGDGYADIWLDEFTYKIVVTDSDDVQKLETDGYPGSIALLETVTSQSTSSVAIAIASKTFTVSANKAFPVGGFALITYNQDITKYMHGQITSYSGTTLVVNVTVIGSSGTFNDWTVSLSGPQGATGPAGGAGGGTGDMLKAENLSGLANNTTARGNLGLGSAAVLDAGITANHVVQLDGSAKLPAVDGSALTNVNISLTPGGVGTTAFLTHSGGGDFQFGDTTSGSNLQPSNCSSTSGTHGAMAGTWQCAGFCTGTSSGSTTQWQRIA